MSNYTHNHDRTAKQCSIFDEYNSTADIPGTLTITLLEDCRGDGCSYTTDPTVINNVLADFSGDASVKMIISGDPSGGGLVLTLSNTTEQPPTPAPGSHGNRVGYVERDPETGLLWYSRGDIGDIRSI